MVKCGNLYNQVTLLLSLRKQLPDNCAAASIDRELFKLCQLDVFILNFSDTAFVQL